MNTFFKSVAGKTVLFIICLLSACILAGSVVLAAALLDEGTYFYTHSEDWVKTHAVESRLRSDGRYWIIDIENKTVPEISERILCEIIGEDGRQMYLTEGAEGISSWGYSVECTLYEYNDGTYGPIPYYVRTQEEDAEEYARHYTINMSLTGELSEYSIILEVIHIAYALRYLVFAIGLAAAVICIACVVKLMCVAGWRPGGTEPVPGLLRKVPYDLILCGYGVLMAALMEIGDELGWFDALYGIIPLAGVLVIGVGMFIGICMCTASRIKQQNLLKNTVIWYVLKLVWRLLVLVWAGLRKLHAFNCMIVKNIPFVWRTGLAIVGVSIVEFLVMDGVFYDGNALIWAFLIERMIILPIGLYIAVCLRRLQAGGRALAAGDLSYTTETKGLFGDLKGHAKDLNSIAVGMTIAVEDRMKSERMKTELITNVSHDLKTPLTSIINYSTLISSEPCENEKIKEYSEVLIRQSERLKRLIEDLVEASKASTGNLEVNPAPCDASVFLTQAAGEYEEKLAAANLTLIVTQPEKEVRIMADGRRMWRIFDNLLSNICKYSLAGTRVYLSLEESYGKALITFKNTSREPLNLSEEELMERFTRGDSSRNTEGNGLGLSIARSLAELQGGAFKLVVDGDLFKVILSFPTI